MLPFVTLLVALAPLLVARASDAPKSQGELTLQAARSIETKFQTLANKAPKTPAALEPIVVTETEANSYFKFRGQEFFPPGVHDAEIRITPSAVTGSAWVNFDELNKGGAASDDWGAKIFAAIFRGRQRVSAVGKLQTGNSQGKVAIENVTIGDISVPQALVDFIVQSYVEDRYKLDLTKPFPLPAHVTHIGLGEGRATFYRSAGP